MKIYLIAQIIEGNKPWGYRLIDIDDNNKVNDYPISSIKSVLSNPATADIINNAKLVNGEITGSNGQLSRYAKITRGGMLISSHGESPLVIINKIDDLGYTVVNYAGVIKKMKNSDVVEYAKSFGIANGKIVVQDSIEYISSISDSYEQISVAPSKVGAKSRVNISIPMGRDSSTMAKHAENDINTELQYSDVFSAMSPEQRAVLKNYYTWYTVDTYQKLAKNVRLNLAPGKAEKLAQLRGIEKWKFAGVNDSYLEGRYNAKCELGHSLRYEYFAIPEDDTEDLSAKTKDWNNLYKFRTTNGAQEDLRDRGAIIFGETCAGDFFNIAPEDMKKLVKVRKQMSEEIELIADIITNKMESMYVQKCEFLYMVLKELNTPEKIVKVFGYKVGPTLMAFLKTKMPFPKSLVILAGNEARNNTEVFFKELFRENTKFIDAVLSAKNTNTNTFFNNVNSLYKYIVNFTIEGEYQYNPLTDKDNTRRDVGAYNKETRQERSYIIKSIKAGTMLYTETINLEELKLWINVMDKAYNKCEQLVKYIDNSVTIQASIKEKESRLTGEISRAASNTDKVTNADDVALYDYMASVLSMSYKYSARNYLSMKTKCYSYHRTPAYRSGLDEFIEIQDKVLSMSEEDFLKNTIKKYENTLQEYMEEQQRIEFNKLRYYEVKLNEKSCHLERFKELPVILACAGEQKEWIQEIQKGKGSSNNMLIAYHDTNVLVPCDTIYADSIVELTEYEYLTKKDIINRALLQIQRAKRELEEQKKAEEAKQREEEQKRIAEQKKREEEEAQLIAFEQDETMQNLKKVLDANQNVVDYGTDIARDILSRKLPFDKLSSKQQWRVKETINRLGDDSVKSQITVDNDKKKLEDNPEVAKNIDKLLDIHKNKDKDAINKVNSASKIAFDIAKTIKYKGEYSSKQIKHIEKAIEALK